MGTKFRSTREYSPPKFNIFTLRPSRLKQTINPIAAKDVLSVRRTNQKAEGWKPTKPRKRFASKTMKTQETMMIH